MEGGWGNRLCRVCNIHFDVRYFVSAGKHKQADCRDSGALHHCHGQDQAGHSVHGRDTRRAQGQSFFLVAEFQRINP